MPNNAKVTLYLDEELATALRQLAKARRASRSFIVREMIAPHLLPQYEPERTHEPLPPLTAPALTSNS